MAFAPNLYAFPGGTVDPRDASADVAWCGPELADWSVRLGLTPDDARAVICAAVREVFEECGVLLAGPDQTSVLGNVEGEEWERIRVALVARELSLAELLAARGLAVRADLLTAWSRWLTPEFEPRRYDTFFFLARLPGEQRTRDVGGETIDTVWLRPSEAGRLPMLPPTAHTLHQLCAYSSIESALAAGPTHDLTTPSMPHIRIDADGARLALPTAL
jgi:8-oxo-dGTP pyrophosphatase MutT (NUDIX family)